MNDDDEMGPINASEESIAIRMAKAKLKFMLENGNEEAIKNFLSQRMKDSSQMAPSSKDD
ncbi:hypothetical protein GC177_10265 [bacterium]|nr:hypothetical protein [bacterium]